MRDEDEDTARRLYDEFCKQWKIAYPLHSVDIRAKAKRFGWLRNLSHKDRHAFFKSLDDLAVAVPVIGIACVIDRVGYNARYRAKYGRDRWSLCKTAFCVAVERAVKLAVADDRKLRVLPERCNEKDDQKLAGYFKMLRADGQPFEDAASAKYGPLTADDFRKCLYEFKPKNKSSPMAQLADLYLRPMCVAGYDRKYYPYRLLMKHGKLVDATLRPEETETLGIKYSCFDGTVGRGGR